MSTSRKPPLTRSYVMNATYGHILRDIAVSTDKTTARIPEFDGANGEGAVCLQTLDALHRFRRHIEAFRADNPALFTDKP